jgi:fluoride ion exporter CrcB/FEX
VTEWWVLPGVAALGALGALVRFGVANLPFLEGKRPTWAITAVNLVGAGGAGFVAGGDHPVAWLIAVGLLGSLTTFSTIVVWMAEDLTGRQPVTAVAIALWHVIGGIPVALAGFALSPSGLFPMLT